ncbi:GNAT family N-acetyltransferase [Streptomyces sp. CA-210063]|uniref:GNAT family N-acetyltransferase n=1 Tax=Streptomyces sp. CA-210063 TaxID=2801029 RepID=UPI00214AA6AA|nr:GNAT family N-acetyltransferase [Streptomyces sp. CA-210063]UUU33925.1 GNAT family N-acetyltransferase [Streptomyces sp. CA-210063]
MTTELRALGKDDWNVWYDNFLRAFGGSPDLAEEREFWQTLTECDRSIGAWDGDQCVGTAAAFDFRISVPGGTVVPAAGVTMVSVAATHRRRGVLTSMMRRQLDDVRSRGESLAVLTASEPVIYGRFGYGLASHRMSAEIDTTRVRLSVPPGTDDLRLRYANPADVLDVCEAVYARRVPERPGMLARRPGWEQVEMRDSDRHRDGASPLQCVVAERIGGGGGDGSEVVGYARFRTKSDWGPGGAEGVVALSALEAVDPAAHAALWRFLFDIDLTSKIVAHRLPVDEPALHLVSDIRRCGLRVKDDLYVRLVDVGAALRARTYQAPLDVVFEVEDSFCPWNEGRWRLTGDPKGATCERTADAADLSLSVRELGTAYLGGVSLASLAAAGRVRELRQGAVAEASTGFFAAGLAPWLPHGF